jgi:hypothetical protein
MSNWQDFHADRSFVDDTEMGYVTSWLAVSMIIQECGTENFGSLRSNFTFSFRITINNSNQSFAPVRQSLRCLTYE